MQLELETVSALLAPPVSSAAPVPRLARRVLPVRTRLQSVRVCATSALMERAALRLVQPHLPFALIALLGITVWPARPRVARVLGARSVLSRAPWLAQIVLLELTVIKRPVSAAPIALQDFSIQRPRGPTFLRAWNAIRAALRPILVLPIALRAPPGRSLLALQTFDARFAVLTNTSLLPSA